MPATRKVFISYAREDGEDFARDLNRRLAEAHLDLPPWRDRELMEGGRGWWKQIEEAIDSSRFLVLVMTPAAMTSQTTRKEWRYARQQGVVVYPVKGVPNSELDYSALPAWMRKSHFFDLTREWESFLNYLRSDREVPRVPYMAPDLPEGFVERPAQFDELLGLLLDKDRENPVAITTALSGAGGYGKTTLAKALCHDNRIIDAFDDGILWSTLGEDADQSTVLRELGKLYYALTRERPAFPDAEEASIELAQKLENLSCLIVIDDVWKQELLKPFLRGGRGCARLITARLFPVAKAAGGRPVKVDEMTADESVQMLLRRVPESERPADLKPFCELARRLGEWPLLLHLAAGAMRAELDWEEELMGAFDSVNRALEKDGIFAFDPTDGGQRDEAVAKTIEVSMHFLKPEEDRVRFLELAIFPEDAAIPLTTLEKLWSLDELETKKAAIRLANHSLLELDLKQKTVGLHDLMRAYAALRLPDPTAVHRRLVSAWGDFLRLPDEYAWRWAAYHLSRTECPAELRRVLFDFDWLLAKLEATDANALIADLEYLLEDVDALLLQGAIRLSAHVLVKDSRQLANQLTGRLLGAKSQGIQDLLSDVAQWRGANWLRPLVATLTPPGGPLQQILESHFNQVAAVAVTHDGRRAVSASRDETLRVWDLESGTSILCLEGHSDWVTAVAVTPDGRHAVSASSDKTLRIWDLESGTGLNRLAGHSAPVNAVAVTPDGRRAVSASWDKTLRVWDLKSGTSILSLEGHSSSVTGVAVTPDGRRAVSTSFDKTLRVWDLKSGTSILSLEGHSSSVTGVAVTPDGRRAVSTSFDKTLRIWDLEGGTGLHRLEGHSDSVSAVAVTPDGRRAVSASWDKTLRIWDLKSGTSILSLEGHSSSVTGVVVTSDGRRAVSASWDKTLRVWDLGSGRSLLCLEGHSDWVTAVAVTPDGRRAVSASRDKTLRVWDLECRTSLHSFEGHSSSVTAVVVTPDRGRAVSASWDKTLRVWDLKSGTSIHSLEGHAAPVTAVAVTPDSRRAVSASFDKTLRVWDLESGTGLHSLEGHSEMVTAVAVTPEGQRAVSAAEDNTLRVWDLESETSLHSLEGHSGKVTAVAVTPDGGRAVSASWDETLRVWDLESGTRIHSLEGHSSPVAAVAVTPDGRRAISASWDETLRVWDLESGTSLHSLEGHSSLVTAVSVTPDGRRAVSASWDRTLRVWDLETGKSLLSLKGHSSRVKAVAVTPDGRRAVSASRDKTLRVWDLETGRPIQTAWADAFPTYCAFISGQRIVAGDTGGVVHFLQSEEAPARSDRDTVARTLFLFPSPLASSQTGVQDTSGKFDVFLAHNSLDKPAVSITAEALRRRGLRAWLDVEEIPPGRWFQDFLQAAIPKVNSAAIFLGPHGLGKWQAVELRSFVSQCVERDIPVIPVLLPGVNEIPNHLVFLRELNAVKFQSSANEARALDRLVWGITGKRPGANAEGA